MTEDDLIDAQALLPPHQATTTLPPLSWRIQKKGIHCLVGPDSVLLNRYLRTLAAIDRPGAGSLTLAPELGLLRPEALRMKLAYIPRNAPLLSVLNGLQNVTLPALYHQLCTREEAEAKAHQLLDALSFEGDLSRLPAYLPPLQRTQLAIARALILEPLAMLLDVPYHTLEPGQQERLSRFFLRWGGQHSLVMATHKLSFVRQHADSIHFCGENAGYHFASWEALCQSEDDEVQGYLRYYQNNLEP